jgi:predicted enzyme related to lactoylglutathione lyase
VRHGVFAADDVAYTYEKMKANGVVFDVAPTKQPWGTFAIFRDLDDNTFVLSST